MTRNKVLLITHNDMDGFMAAYLLHRVYSHLGAENIILREINYDVQTVPDIPDDVGSVFITDFSFPPQAFMDAVRKYPDVGFRMLDHHETAIDKWEGWPLKGDNYQVLFDKTVSGAGLTMAFIATIVREATGNHDIVLEDIEFFNERLIKACQYVDDRDLWQFKFGNETKAMHDLLLSIPKTFSSWDDWFFGVDDESFKIVFDGFLKEVLKMETIYERIAEKHHLTTFQGHDVAIFSCPSIYVSYTSETVRRLSGKDVVINIIPTEKGGIVLYPVIRRKFNFCS